MRGPQQQTMMVVRTWRCVGRRRQSTRMGVAVPLLQDEAQSQRQREEQWKRERQYQEGVEHAPRDRFLVTVLKSEGTSAWPD